MLYLSHRRSAPTAVAVYGLRSTSVRGSDAKGLSTPYLYLRAMPRDGLKPITVSEEAWKAVKQLTEAEDTDFDTYDEFVRHSCTSADDHFGVLDEEVRDGIDDGA